MSTTILTSLSTYMSKTSSMTTSKLKFVILKRLNKWKIKKKIRGGSCPGGKCTKVGGGRCHKNRGGRCHKNGGGKCPGGKCNTTVILSQTSILRMLLFLASKDWNAVVKGVTIWHSWELDSIIWHERRRTSKNYEENQTFLQNIKKHFLANQSSNSLNCDLMSGRWCDI